MKKIMAVALAGVMSLGMAACGGSTNSTQADAQNGAGYPNSTINVVVPFNAGSNTDSQIRYIQQYLEKSLGQSVVVTNDGGASGTIGTSNFLEAGKDGYTVLYSLPTPTVYKPAAGETAYTVEDLLPAARVSQAPMYLVVKDGSKYDMEAADLIQYIKENPNEFTYGNAGNGGIAQMALAVFLYGEDLQATSVPFAGGTADEYTAVMGDTVNSYVCGEQDVSGREGVHAVINLGTKSETPGFEDVPTLSELGYDGYCTDNFAGFYFAAGTDENIVETFSKAVETALTSEEFVAAAEASNFEVSFGDAATFADQVTETANTITPVLKEMGMAS